MATYAWARYRKIEYYIVKESEKYSWNLYDDMDYTMTLFNRVYNVDPYLYPEGDQKSISCNKKASLFIDELKSAHKDGYVYMRRPIYDYHDEYLLSYSFVKFNGVSGYEWDGEKNKYYCTVDLLSSAKYVKEKKGDLIDIVTADSPSFYANTIGEKNYWYEFIGKAPGTILRLYNNVDIHENNFVNIMKTSIKLLGGGTGSQPSNQTRRSIAYSIKEVC